ncbi:MAG: hypothetical protein OEZ47_10525 [Gammaproteobacteria bacterium]|nr:hypothetical protein [Gammaproteobacteria bacterium]
MKAGIGLIASVFLVSAVSLQAAEVPESAIKKFNAGEKAVAQDVNDNFEALRDAVNQLARQIEGINTVSSAAFTDGVTTDWVGEPGHAGDTTGYNAPISANPRAGTEYAIANPNGETLWVYNDKFQKIDKSKTYEVSGWFRRSSGDGTAGNLYLAVKLRDSTGTNIGGDGSWWYYPVIQATPDANWVMYQGSFGAGTSKPFPDEAVDMTVGAILNHNGDSVGDRIFEMTALGIKVIPTPEPWQDLVIETGLFPYNNVDSKYQIPQFRKQGDMVCLRGLVGGSETGNKVIAYLPAGFAPPKRLIFHSSGHGTTAGDRVDVYKGTGSLKRTHIFLTTVDNATSGTEWTSLDGMCWSVAP